MSRLQWAAEGIEAAEAAGGLLLESYYRPGFTGGPAVRVAGGPVSAVANAELELDEEDE